MKKYTTDITPLLDAKARGYTNSVLGVLLNVTPQTISYWKQRGKVPTEVMDKIKTHLESNPSVQGLKDMSAQTTGFLPLLEDAYELGLNDHSCARLLQVHVTTLYKWKKLDRGRADAMGRLKNHLKELKRAEEIAARKANALDNELPLTPNDSDLSNSPSNGESTTASFKSGKLTQSIHLPKPEPAPKPKLKTEKPSDGALLYAVKLGQEWYQADELTTAVMTALEDYQNGKPVSSEDAERLMEQAEYAPMGVDPGRLKWHPVSDRLKVRTTWRLEEK